MNKELDDMLYAVYLAKLESLKGTKKPLVDFIKEMATNTNDFSSLTYRQFKLVTIAIHNCIAVNIISPILLNKLQQRLTMLIRICATEENILDLLEFYKNTINFSPTNLEQFIYMDRLYNIVRSNRPELKINFHTNNVSLFNRFSYLRYAAIHKHNPGSLYLKQLIKASETELAKAKEYSIELIELLEYEDHLNNKELE